MNASSQASAIHHFSLRGLRASASVPVITAVGSGPAFAYHASKGSAAATLFNVGSPTCVCRDTSGQAFGKGTGKSRTGATLHEWCQGRAWPLARAQAKAHR